MSGVRAARPRTGHSVVDDVPDDDRADRLEHLVGGPRDDGRGVGEVDAAGQLRDECGRVDDLKGEVAVGPQLYDEPGLGVAHRVDRTAEREVGELVRADEEKLGIVGVSTAQLVGDIAEEGQLARVDLVSTRLQQSDDATLRDEDGQLIDVHDCACETADLVVGPLEKQLPLGAVGHRDEFATDVVAETHQDSCGRGGRTETAPSLVGVPASVLEAPVLEVGETGPTMPAPGELLFVAPRRAKPPRHLADLSPADRRAAVGELGQPPFRASQLSNALLQPAGR